MEALALALTAAVPVLGPFALAIAAAALLLGVGALLLQATQQVTMGSYIDRVRALFNLRTLIASIMAQPLVQEVLTRQGTEAALLSQSAGVAITAAAASQVPLLQFPYDATLQELELWYQGEGALWSLGVSTQDRINAAYSFYVAQSTTLRAALAPAVVPAPVQAVTPLTQVEVPGFGRVGVTVRVGGQLITTGAVPAPFPAAAPAAPTPIVNVNLDTQALATALAAALSTALTQQGVAIEEGLAKGGTATGEGLKALSPALVGAMAALGLTMSGALTGVGTNVATGIGAQAQNLGHGMQQGRYSCQGDFLGSLLGLFSKIGPQLLIGGILATDNPVRQELDKLVKNLIEKELSYDRFVPATTYEMAVENASTRLTQAVGFGLQAQAIAYTAEAMTPMKQMGFSQIAGFMGDLAGFQRIAAGLMGTVETAAIYRPLQYEANRRFHPNLPDVSRAVSLFEKREIPWSGSDARPGLEQLIAYAGLSDYWAGVYQEDAYRDPSLREVRSTSNFWAPALVPEMAAPPDDVAEYLTRAGVDPGGLQGGDWLYAFAALKSAYNPALVPWVIGAAKRSVGARARSALQATVGMMVRDGFMPLEGARARIRESWDFTDPIGDQLKALELSRDYALLKDTRAVVVLSMTRGLITREEARTQLGRLGMDGQRVELEVLKGTLGMLPGMRIEVSRPEEVLEEAGVEGE